MEFNGVQWSSMEFNGVQWSSIEFNRVQSSSIEFNRVQSSSIEFNRVKQSSIEFNRVQSSSIEFNRVQSSSIELDECSAHRGCCSRRPPLRRCPLGRSTGRAARRYSSPRRPQWPLREIRAPRRNAPRRPR